MRQLTERQHRELDRIAAHAKVVGWLIDGPVIRTRRVYVYMDTRGVLFQLPIGPKTMIE